MNYIKAAAFDLIFLQHNVLYNHWLHHPLGPTFLLTQAVGAVQQSSVGAEFDLCFALKIEVTSVTSLFSYKFFILTC